LDSRVIETALIDSDIVAYRCAAATENDTEDIARWQTSEMMRRILHETNAMRYKCFISGSDNFRYAVYPEYKANRKDMPKPKHLQVVREHLVTEWQAVIADGVEADDLMGIAQCSEHDGDTVICTIDKDLLMIPGRHYNFVKQEFRHVSPLEGIRHLYLQAILGDRADNIFGFDGKARSKVPKFLQDNVDVIETLTDESDMFDYVRDMYNDDVRYLTNLSCLWIQRHDGDFYFRREVVRQKAKILQETAMDDSLLCVLQNIEKTIM
jgi:hypothetical protein